MIIDKFNVQKTRAKGTAHTHRGQASRVQAIRMKSRQVTLPRLKFMGDEVSDMEVKRDR